MDVTASFFEKLRALAVRLEKQAEQFKHTFHNNDTDLEDDSPMIYLHELFSEVRTLKVDAGHALTKSSSERDATYDFIKDTKVLMKRNATDIEKIRELFQKYGYIPLAANDAAVKDEAEINSQSTESDKQEEKNIAYPEKSSGPHHPLRLPQLSDFGLSKYAFPSTLDAVYLQPQAHAQKEEPRVDYSECLSSKTEHFRICSRDLHLNNDTVSLTEDQTIYLLNSTKNLRQTNELSGSAMEASKNSLATPKKKTKLCDYDYMASPPVPVFCTPGLKISSKKECLDVCLPKSPESNQSDVYNPTTEIKLQEVLPLKSEPKQIFDTTLVTHKRPIESAISTVIHSEKYLEHVKEPSPPTVSDYRSLYGTPPSPKITQIPEQIFQMLSKCNLNTQTTKSMDKVTKKGTATQFERAPIFCTGEKENKVAESLLPAV